MLTRLRVKGFKNLADVDVAFGPFTCVAGANAVGKSNLFDAILFLRDLVDYPILEAASRVRDPDGKGSALRSLFTRSREGIVDEVTFSVDVLVPDEVVDDFGRVAKPTSTFLNYVLVLRLLEGPGIEDDRIELVYESLVHIPKGKAKKRLGFKFKKSFAESIAQNRTRPLISTEIRDGEAIVKLHQDGGNRGRPSITIPAAKSRQTVLRGINSADEPTVLAVKREMQAWFALQLEPSALRKPDTFASESHVTSHGEHLASTLYRTDAADTVARDLKQLLPDVKEVLVDSDPVRRLRSLVMKGRDGVEHPARSLSDGTLRFVALAIMRHDPALRGVICLEEPENGIHPTRIPSMLSLLQRMAVRIDRSVSNENPLRQIIINTHSPLVLQYLNYDSIVFARTIHDSTTSAVQFVALPDTWRTCSQIEEPMEIAALGSLLPYLTGPSDILGDPDLPSDSMLATAASQSAFDFMFGAK